MFAAYALLGGYDLFLGQLAPDAWRNKAPRLSDAIGTVPWEIWVIVGLALTVVASVEGGYRAQKRGLAPETAGEESELRGLTPDIFEAEEIEWHHEPEYDQRYKGLGIKCSNHGRKPIRCRIRLVGMASWFKETGVWYEKEVFTPRLLRWSFSGDGPDEVAIASGSDRVCCLVIVSPTQDRMAHIAAGSMTDMANKVLMDLHRARYVVEADGYVGICREVFFEWRPGPIVLGTQINELEFVAAEQIPGRITPQPAQARETEADET